MAVPQHSRRRQIAQWWGDVHLYFLAGMALTALLLGTVGFRQWYAAQGATGATLWDALYKAMQLFTLESGSAEVPVPPLLNLARFLALFTALYGAGAALVAVFGERFARLRLRWAKGHAIVCGLGDRGLHLTERLDPRHRRVAVIERDEHAPLLDRARAAGAVPVIGDAANPAVLRRARAHRAAQVFAVCPEAGANAEIAVALMKLVGEAGTGPPVVVVTHIDDTELCELLREQAALGEGHRRVVLNFFNVPEGGARAMLLAVPPHALHEGGAPHIVVVGLGKLGRSLVMAAARHWLQNRPPGPPLPRVTMIDQSAQAKAELLRVRFPQIDAACTLLPLTLPKNAAEFERGDYLRDAVGKLNVDAVYVCPDDDVHSLAAALTIQHHTRGSGVPIAVRMTREGGLATLLETGGAGAFADLRGVGVLDAACDPEALAGA
ncbi:MAG: NAD-binding protein [Actinomycetota bacterium]